MEKCLFDLYKLLYTYRGPGSSTENWFWFALMQLSKLFWQTKVDYSKTKNPDFLVASLAMLPVNRAGV